MPSNSDRHEPSVPATNSEPVPHETASTRRSEFEATIERLPRVVSVSSRAPVVRTNRGWSVAPGGLAPIVSHALSERGGAWVSWDGGATDSPPQQVEGLGFDTYTFSMARKAGEGFYGGFANRTLWPLLHDSVVTPVFERAWWKEYVNASHAFALSTAITADRLGDKPTLWVHDYHLFLLPRLLREAGVDNPLSFFLHTPFPSPSIFARLPQRDAVLNGLAGADLVGFHTEGDRQRFRAAWSQIGAGPPPHTAVVPASIDSAAFARDASRAMTLRQAAVLRERLGGRILLLGTERLDYTKGIPERLRALEVLLDRRPDLRRRVVYVQVAHPSRERVPEYRQLRAVVEREIGRLNGKFTMPGMDIPFRYLHRSVTHSQLMAYYVAADVALVTPLSDGMNLVAKEFVVAQTAAKRSGALVLSEFAGAAAELTDAFLCNPFDAEGTADVIEEAIEASEEERRKRLSVMTVHIDNNDIAHWSDQLLRGAERACRAAV